MIICTYLHYTCVYVIYTCTQSHTYMYSALHVHVHCVLYNVVLHSIDCITICHYSIIIIIIIIILG